MDPSQPIGIQPSIPVPAPPSVSDGQERMLDPKSVLLARIQGVIFASAVFFVGLIAVSIVVPQLDEVPTWIRILIVVGWASLVVFLYAWSLFWPAVAYRYARIRVDDEGLQIKRGVLWRSVTSIPRSRVQHTDVAQGPVERWAGLARLIVHTAGTHDASVSVPGLSEGLANAIRDHLLDTGQGDAV